MTLGSNGLVVTEAHNHNYVHTTGIMRLSCCFQRLTCVKTTQLKLCERRLQLCAHNCNDVLLTLESRHRLKHAAPARGQEAIDCNKRAMTLDCVCVCLVCVCVHPLPHTHTHTHCVCLVCVFLVWVCVCLVCVCMSVYS